MAKYTVLLKDILRSGYNPGLVDYQIFSEEYRKRLNEKLLNHYMWYEIGFETPPRFFYELNIRMNEIMPYYDQLLQSELLLKNPLLSFSFERKENRDKTSDSDTSQNIDNETSLINVTRSDTTESQTTDINKNQTSEEETTRAYADSRDGKTTEQDTPMSLLDSEEIEAGDYASGITSTSEKGFQDETLNGSKSMNDTESKSMNINSGTVNTNDTGTTSSTDNDTTVHTVDSEVVVITENGTRISESELLLKYRETFLNVDMMIIEELKDLFMLVY